MLTLKRAKELAKSAQEERRKNQAAAEKLEKKRQRVARQIETNFDRFYEAFRTKLFDRAAQGCFYILRDTSINHDLLKDALVNDEVWPRSLADVISAKEVASSVVMQSLLRASSRDKAADLIYYWGSARVSSMKRELGGMLFFIASPQGQSILKWLSAEIERGAARGRAKIRIEWDSFDHPSVVTLGVSSKEAIFECLRALGFAADPLDSVGDFFTISL